MKSGFFHGNGDFSSTGGHMASGSAETPAFRVSDCAETAASELANAARKVQALCRQTSSRQNASPPKFWMLGKDPRAQ
jgi:hypothetical protein